jgi:hypothetical protein
MRILFVPDRFVLKCPLDSTVVEVKKDEVSFEAGGVLPSRNFLYYEGKKRDDEGPVFVVCPLCEHYFVTDDIVQPEISLKEEDGECPFCQTAIGKDDKHCSNCGAPIKRKGTVKLNDRKE